MATEDPGVSPDLRSPPASGLRSVREGGSRSSQGGGGSRPGKGAAAHPSPAKSPRHLRAQLCPGPTPPWVPLRPARVHSVTPAQSQRQEGAREAAWVPVLASRRPGDRPGPFRPRCPRAARLLPRGQPGGGGRSVPAAVCPLRARRQPGRQCTVARVPPRGPVGGGRWCAAGEGPGRSRRRDWGAVPPSLQTVMVMSGSV